VEGTLEPSKLAQIQASGGERRAEGFGQLCFNDHLDSSDFHSWAATEQKISRLTNQGSYFKRRAFSLSVEKAAWQRLMSSLTELLLVHYPQKRFGDRTKKKPTIWSQLGALRSVLGRLQQPEEDPEHPGCGD